MASYAPSLPAWPPAAGLSTILVPRAENNLSVFSSAQINAPAALVFNTILNTTSYPEWNTFTPAAVITYTPNPTSPNAFSFLAKGVEFTYIVVLNPETPEVKTPSPEKVYDISIPSAPSDYVPRKLLKNDGSWYPNLRKVYRASWGDNNPATTGQLVTERFSEVIVLGKEKSEYRTWENYGGPLAPVINEQLADTLQARFEDYARDLKGYSEKLYKASKKMGGKLRV